MKKAGIALLIAAAIVAYGYGVLFRAMSPAFWADLGKGRRALSSITAVGFNPDNLLFCVGDEDGNLNIYDASKRGHVITVRAHGYRVSYLASSSDGSMLASSSSLEDETKIWDPQTGREIGAIPDTNGPEVFAGDSHTLYLANNDELRLYDLNNGRFSPSRYHAKGVIESLAVSPDGEYLAVGTTGNIQVWRIRRHYEGISFRQGLQGQKRPLLELVSGNDLYGPKDWIKTIAFTKDGRRIVSISRFGSVDVFSSPYLTQRKQYASPLKHLSSGIYIADRHAVLLAGTEDPVGVGRGFAELLWLQSGASYMVREGLSNLPVATVIRDSGVALLADSGRFSIVGFGGIFGALNPICRGDQRPPESTGL